MRCRFIDTSGNDAYANMAIDEALLACSNEPVLRVYQWKAPSVTVGYNQRAAKEINLAECRKSKIPVVRRITGGKAVFHDKELTYSFIVPKNTVRMPDEVTASYRIIAKSILSAFQRIGIKAVMKKLPEKFSAPACFSSSNWYEIFAGGRKICGSAQKRMNGKILQHGSLLIDFDYEKNALLFCQSSKELENLKKRVTSIKKELNKGINSNALAEALKYGFKKNLKMDFFQDSLAETEIKLSESLKNEKYSKDEWNFRL